MILAKDAIKPEGKFRMSFAGFELLCEMKFFREARVEFLVVAEFWNTLKKLSTALG